MVTGNGRKSQGSGVKIVLKTFSIYHFPFLICHWLKETAKPPRIAEDAKEWSELNTLSLALCFTSVSNTICENFVSEQSSKY